jgi:hypothetical protein
MKEMSVIQKYMVCSVNAKGKISNFNVEKMVCFLAAGILELQLEGCISVNANKVDIISTLPADRQYLKSLYDFIEQKRPVKMNKIAEAYHISLTNKRFRELMEAVGGSLVGLGLAEEKKAGLTGNKKCYIPSTEAIRSVVELLRAELLEDGEITEDTAVLVILLEKGKCLKPYFSQFEQREIKKKLHEIVSSPNGKLVKDMVAHIESILAVAAASASSASV